MTPAERAALMGLADEWDEVIARLLAHKNLYAQGVVESMGICAKKLRALLAEFEREDGDG